MEPTTTASPEHTKAVDRWERGVKNWSSMVMIGAVGIVWPFVGLVIALHKHQQVLLSVFTLIWFPLSGLMLFSAGYFFNERVRRLGTRGGLLPNTRRPPGV